jgi:AcrR family transcriptional regulator
MKTSTVSNVNSRRLSLNSGRIFQGAVGLADEIGVDALTIRKLAVVLGVKPMTIYHYIPNKEAIIDGMVDRVFGEIDLPQLDINWKLAIQQRSASARAVLVKHSWAVPLMESRRTPGIATLRQHDATIGCLRKGGLSVEMTAHAYAVIDAFVYGFAIQEASLPAKSGLEMKELAESILETTLMANYTHLMELTTRHVLQPDYDFSCEFDFGLNLILDGLENAVRLSVPPDKG